MKTSNSIFKESRAYGYIKGYEDGIKQGREDTIVEFVELLKNYFVIPHDVMIIEQYAEQLKEQKGE